MQQVALYLLPFFAKSMSVYYFVLLPPLLAKHYINAAEVGYIGALSIGSLVLGAFVVSRRLYKQSSKKTIKLGVWIAVSGVALLCAGIATRNLWLIALSFVASGFEVGLSMSAANAIVADHTNRGNRYRALGRMSMLSDAGRLAAPVLVAGAISLGGLTLTVWLVGLMSVLFLIVSVVVPDGSRTIPTDAVGPHVKLRANKPFYFFLSLEFLDSFASSQLFVFVPILFLAKGYSLQNSLLLQTAVFLGYLSGRWLITEVAHRINGVSAVMLAEIGMSLSAVLLLIAPNLIALYMLAWVLGIFARGTSPVIKALAFDSLRKSQIKRGSAVHVIAGDSGSALGQLVFGLLLAWYGINAPFLTAAVLGVGIAFMTVGFIKTNR